MLKWYLFWSDLTDSPCLKMKETQSEGVVFEARPSFIASCFVKLIHCRCSDNFAVFFYCPCCFAVIADDLFDAEMDSEDDDKNTDENKNPVCNLCLSSSD